MYIVDSKIKLKIREWHEKVYKAMLAGMTDEERAEWEITRERIFRRDKMTCQRCDKKFRYKKYLSVHHIISRADGGGNNDQNLTTLCLPCHDYVEINDLKTKAAIAGSFESEEIHGLISIVEEETDPYNRPDWHKYVYGGQRRSG